MRWRVFVTHNGDIELFLSPMRNYRKLMSVMLSDSPMVKEASRVHGAYEAIHHGYLSNAFTRGHYISSPRM